MLPMLISITVAVVLATTQTSTILTTDMPLTTTHTTRRTTRLTCPPLDQMADMPPWRSIAFDTRLRMSSTVFLVDTALKTPFAVARILICGRKPDITVVLRMALGIQVWDRPGRLII